MFGRNKKDEFNINDYDDSYDEEEDFDEEDPHRRPSRQPADELVSYTDRNINEEDYDRDGYDADGFDMDGYDREGYHHSGFNEDGYDRDGYHHTQYEEEEPEDSDDYDEAADGDDYADDDKPEKKSWAGKIVAVIGIFTACVVAYTLFTGGSDKPSKETHNATVEKLIGIMYQAKDVDELISRNETILGYFVDGAQSDVNIADSEIYLTRYSDFKNLETTVDIKNISESNGVIYATYSISNSVDPASERLGVFEFDDKNKIDFFKEYRMYPVGE